MTDPIEPSSEPSSEPSAERAGDRSREPRTIEVGSVRRAPRYRAFLLTGAVVGFAAGLVVAVLAPGVAGSPFTDRTVAGFLGMALGLLGALIGGTVAVVADRRSARDL